MAILLVLTISPSLTQAADVNNILVSAALSGQPYVNGGIWPQISQNGDKVLFLSVSNDVEPDPLVSGITSYDPQNDLFVRDVNTNTTKEVNISSDGHEIGINQYNLRPSFVPGAISSDGTKVLFASGSNFGDSDTNGKTDLFIKDLESKDLQNVTTRSGIDGSGVVIDIIDATPDLKYVVLHVQSNELSSLWSQGRGYYRLDTQTHQAVKLPFNPTESMPYSISDSGNYVSVEVAYPMHVDNPNGTSSDYAENRAFRYDVQNNSSIQLSIDVNGNFVRGDMPKLSGDGNKAVFLSDATIIPSYPNTTRANHVYTMDIPSSTYKWIDKSPVGNNDVSQTAPDISTDANVVSFFGSVNFDPPAEPFEIPYGRNIFAYDTSTDKLLRITNNNAISSAFHPDYVRTSVSSDGKYAAYYAYSNPQSSNMPQVYRKNLEAYLSTPEQPVGLAAVSSPTNTTPSLTWQSVQGATSYKVYRDGVNVASVQTPAYVDNNTSPSAMYSYQVSAVNSVATESNKSGSVQVIVDRVPPTIKNLSWSTNPLLQSENTTLSVDANDVGVGVTSVEYKIDGGSYLPMTLNFATGKWEAVLGSNLSVSTYNVQVRAKDSVGTYSAVVTDVLAVYNAANGYVTGHTKVVPTSNDLLPISLGVGQNPPKLILGFTNLKSATSTTPTSGSFDLSYVVKNNANEFNLSSTGIDWLVVPNSTSASILGHADMKITNDDTTSTVSNVAVRIDIILGQNGGPEHLTVKIFQPDVNPATGTPSWIINEDSVQSTIMIKQ